MPSTDPYSVSGAQLPVLETRADPPALADQLVHWLTVTASHALLGLVLGSLAARELRRRHLHYGWAVCAVAAIVLARGVLAGWAVALGAATLTATTRGRRWHREDLEAGADLAELAARRLRPIDALRTGAGVLVGLARRTSFARRFARGREIAAGSRESRGGWLTVGRDAHDRPVAIPLGGGGGTHTLVLGATGSGKTVTQTWIATQAVARGMGAVVVDPKGDRRMRAELLLAAREAGTRFFEWTPDGPSVYNPVARGGRTEIADKLLAGERFTEPHYLRQAQRYLGHMVGAMRGAGVEVSLGEAARYLDPELLELLARRLPESQARAVHVYLESLTPRQRNDLSGVRDRVAIMAESEVGPWLDPCTPQTTRFDLLETLRARAVVYFDLQADRHPLLARMLGAAIVQDLQTACAAMQSDPTPSLAIVDEFSALAAEQVARLFGRARSAGMSLVLGTQELSDLRPPGGRELLEAVLGNLSAVIAHRQVVPASAALVAQLAGRKGAWSGSLRSDGHSTRRRELVPAIPAEEIGRLGCGRALVVVPAAEAGHARVARMCSSQRAA